MLTDRFDRLSVVALLLVIGALAALLATARPSDGRQAGGGADRRMEQELLAQARMAFLERQYGAVTELRKQGELQSALLKLEELDRKYPGEAHGALLRGDILYRMGLLDRAVASLAVAVRGNGDYLDRTSP